MHRSYNHHAVSPRNSEDRYKEWYTNYDIKSYFNEIFSDIPFCYPVLQLLFPVIVALLMRLSSDVFSVLMSTRRFISMAACLKDVTKVHMMG